MQQRSPAERVSPNYYGWPLDPLLAHA